MDSQNITRRRLLGTAGAAGAAGLVAGGAGGAYGFAASDSGPALTSVGSTAVPFHGTGTTPGTTGTHQGGITTPLQAKAHLIAFDLAAGAGRKDVIALMRRWSRAAEAMTAGRAPDGDDQVALDAGPSSLTVTFGFGRTLFARTGLTGRLPADFVPIPAFSQTRSTRRAAAATCGCRSAPTTRSSPSTPCGSCSAPPRYGGAALADERLQPHAGRDRRGR